LLLKLRQRDDVSAEEEKVVEDLVARTKHVAARSDLVSEGDRPKHSTLIIEGFAARYRQLPDGSRQLTSIHVPGDFVDFHSFLLKEMEHGITALTDCYVVEVPHASLKTVSETHPHLMRLFNLCALIDGAIHREWLVSMGRRRAPMHLAHLICEIYELLEAVQLASNHELRFPITQIDLADILGLSAVHTNRVLQELRRSQLITWDGAVIKILDWPRLRDFADYDNRYLHLVREPR